MSTQDVHIRGVPKDVWIQTKVFAAKYDMTVRAFVIRALRHFITHCATKNFVRDKPKPEIDYGPNEV